MRKHVLFLAFLVFANMGNQIHAQVEGDVKISCENGDNGSYKFYCENRLYCSGVIEINFTRLENLKGVDDNPYKKDITGRGKRLLFTLLPIDPNQTTNFKYSYTYIRGCMKPNINPEFVYLLPIGTGKSTKANQLELVHIGKNPEPKDYYALSFKVNAGDTIYAARRGIVYLVKDTANLTGEGYTYSSKDNYIEIFHEDCSFGHYEVFDKSLVKEGQQVEAGDPMAIAGGEKYVSGAHVRFYVYYNFEQKYAIKNSDGTDVKNYWAYVPLVFYTQEEKAKMLTMNKEYTCEKPESIIIQEMSKRELKNWRKKKP